MTTLVINHLHNRSKRVGGKSGKSCKARGEWQTPQKLQSAGEEAKRGKSDKAREMRQKAGKVTKTAKRGKSEKRKRLGDMMTTLFWLVGAHCMWCWTGYYKYCTTCQMIYKFPNQWQKKCDYKILLTSSDLFHIDKLVLFPAVLLQIAWLDEIHPKPLQYDPELKKQSKPKWDFTRVLTLSFAGPKNLLHNLTHPYVVSP